MAIRLAPLPVGASQRYSPVDLPAGPLSRAATVKFWGADRASLVRCDATKGALLTYHQVLAQQLDAADVRK